MNLGFSYIGLLYLLMLFIPNLFWTKHQPTGYEKYAVRENRILDPVFQKRKENGGFLQQSVGYSGSGGHAAGGGFFAAGSLREESVTGSRRGDTGSRAYRNPCGAFGRDQKGVRMTAKILIIEDEAVIRRELQILLENAMYEAAAPADFGDVPGQVRAFAPDLILLDVNLPGCSGFDLCTQIRAETNVPVIFLTSRTDSMDEVNGILKGGDDYITKPYQAPVLLARIGAVLKRANGGRIKETTQFFHKGVKLDIAGCTLAHGEEQRDLTKAEMKILYQLFRHPGEYISRMDLIEYLWENKIFIDDNTLSVHMTRIREKVKAIGVSELIVTKRGIGYRV